MDTQMPIDIGIEALQLMFETQYNELALAVDPVAERTASCCGVCSSRPS